MVIAAAVAPDRNARRDIADIDDVSQMAIVAMDARRGCAAWRRSCSDSDPALRWHFPSFDCRLPARTTIKAGKAGPISR